MPRFTCVVPNGGPDHPCGGEEQEHDRFDYGAWPRAYPVEEPREGHSVRLPARRAVLTPVKRATWLLPEHRAISWPVDT